MSMSSSEGASTSSSRGHVHFTMTVKVDIDGHTSATATATGSASASGATAISSSSSSSSSSSAPSSSSICAAAAAAANATAASTQDLLLKLQPLLPHLCLPPPRQQRQHQHQQQQQQQHTQQQDRPGEHHESGLELSLGLSCFTQPSGASSFPARDMEDEEEQQQQPQQPQQPQRHELQCEDGADKGGETVSANVGELASPQQQHRQGLVRSDSLPPNWRVLEEQRLKREVQFHKRQEARKKRRILIDEQKQQRRKNTQHHTPKKVVIKDEVVEHESPAAESHPPSGQHKKTSGCRSARSGRSHSHPGYSKRSKKSSDPPATMKAEADENTTPTGNTSTTGATSTNFSGVIRPSPVKNQWVDKFLESRQSHPDEEQAPHAPQEHGVPAVDSQSSSVCSSSMASVPAASGSFACPVASSSTVTTSSGIEEPKACHKVIISSHGDGEYGRLPPPPPLTPPPSLLRSVSLGTFRDQQEQQQQQQRSITNSSSSTLRAPSPVRCSNSSLMRTLSEGAAMRSSLGGGSADSWSRRSSSSSAFKAPKRDVHQVDGAMSWDRRTSSSVSEAVLASRSSNMSGAATSDLPWVSTTGTGPNGKTVTGVLFAYKKGEVKIVCACHGQHMTAKEFVEHAGGVDVPNPEKCIVVSPMRRTASKI